MGYFDKIREKIERAKYNSEISKYTLAPIEAADMPIIAEQERDIVPKIRDYAREEYSALFDGMKLSDEWNVSNLETRKVVNGKDTYYCTSMKGNACIAEGRAGRHCLQFNIDRTEVRHKISDGKNFIQMVLRDNKILEDGEGVVHPKELLCTGKIDGKSLFFRDIYLGNDVDISDINAVRYQLEDDKDEDLKKLGMFIDKYVIVTPDERKAYMEYKAQRDNEDILKQARMKSIKSKSIGK